MNRREFLKCTAAGAAASWLGRVLPAEAKPAPKRRPNVVLIISDDQAWTDCGFMGHRVVRTPRLDRLAARSLVFTRGYVPTALCRPSLATISTGLCPRLPRAELKLSERFWMRATDASVGSWTPRATRSSFGSRKKDSNFGFRISDFGFFKHE